jgi:hypothetical protein
MKTQQILAVALASTLVATEIVATRADAGGPATSFPFAVNAADCSLTSVAGNWITPVDGQDNVLFFVKDLKSQFAISFSQAIDENDTTETHSFALGTLPKGKHKLFFSMQVRVGTAPIIGVEKTVTASCGLP